MTDYQTPEASKVVLTPIDTQGLHSLGCIVTAETITLQRDEKDELLGRVLRKGDRTAIDYVINGTKTNVTYRVSDLEPKCAYIGKGTIVVIEGESPDINRAVGLAHTKAHSPSYSAKEGKRPFRESTGYSTLYARAKIRPALEERVSLLRDDIELCDSAGLDPAKLIAELNSLEKYLVNFW